MEKSLEVKKSSIPGAGKGLFTKKFIPKGRCIIEYKGKITTWKAVNHRNGSNPYIYYVNRNHVIDGSEHLTNLARYVNDAKGPSNNGLLVNNCVFVVVECRVFLEAKRDIQPESELLVGYGKEYWDVMLYNKGLATAARKKKPKSG